MRQCKPSFSGGFSLLEMAIGLAIIGLIVGSLVAGQSLLRASEIRSIVDEEQRILSSALTFKEKYDSIPGDMPNATDLWGVLAADPATCKVTAATGTATCNGDGNGKIGRDSDPGSYEFFRFWQHLANAGMFEGQYNGTAGPLVFNGHHWDCDTNPGGNTPPGKMIGSGYAVWDDRIRSGDWQYFDGEYGHAIHFGVINYDWGGWVDKPVLTPGETASLDQKFDDGRPGTGKIRTFKNSVLPCADSDVTVTAKYNVNFTDPACNLIFLVGF